MKSARIEHGGVNVAAQAALGGLTVGAPTRPGFSDFSGVTLDPGHGERVRFLSQLGDESWAAPGSVRHGGAAGKESEATSATRRP